MLAWLEPVGIAALWAVVFVRAPQGIPRREQRPLWLALVMIALAMSLHLEPVTEALGRVLGGEHRVDLATHLLSIVDAAAVLWFVCGAAGRHRHTRLVFGSALAVMAVLVALDAAAPVHARNRIDPSPAAAGVPDAYWWLFFAFHLLADTTCGFVCWAYGLPGTPRPLRYGLRLFGTGILLASLLWVCKLLYLATRSDALAPLFPLITGCEALCMAAGAVLPEVARVRECLCHLRTHRQLEPLWRDVTAVAPDVVLGPGSLRRAVALPVHLRMYRRVIEIRDALIVLRGYVTPAARDLAERLVTDHGVRGASAEATVAACCIAAALQAKRDGQLPEPREAGFTGPEARGLAQEVEQLLLIASAYRSPAVQAYRAELGDVEPRAQSR